MRMVKSGYLGYKASMLFVLALSPVFAITEFAFGAIDLVVRKVYGRVAADDDYEMWRHQSQ